MMQFEQIIAKLKNRVPLSEGDYRMLYEYLQGEEQEQEFKQALANHWEDVCNSEDLELTEPDDLYYKIFYKAQAQDKPSNVSTRSIGWWVQRIAAILLLPLLVVTALYIHRQQPQALADNRLTIESPAESKTRFFLPDGSSGWLQAGSVLQFSQAAGRREVALKGKAFFEVAKDESNPFIVSTNHFKVKVLGTRFNVEAFEAEAVSRVFLEEGSVEMLGSNNEHQTLLKPGQEYAYYRSEGTFKVKHSSADEQTAWIEGVLVLKNEPLLDAAKKLEQFYNVDIEIKDKELELLPVYAKIENERLEEVLELTRMILPIAYKIERPKQLSDGSFTKRKVVITSNQ
ncbi:FecR family protein [Carboxylicivirga taeanensis]|uniref:FecR family protein n=1 Tax=Carboxylicivirga taeanensis TaxID=1416875 RepID=UPI003F6DBDDB